MVCDSTVAIVFILVSSGIIDTLRAQRTPAPPRQVRMQAQAGGGAVSLRILCVLLI